jgi:hypothetical protein
MTIRESVADSVPNRKTNSLSRGFGVIYKIRSTVELANLANRTSERFSFPGSFQVSYGSGHASFDPAYPKVLHVTREKGPDRRWTLHENQERELSRRDSHLSFLCNHVDALDSHHRGRRMAIRIFCP